MSYSNITSGKKLVRLRDDEAIKSKETSLGLRRHIKTSLNAFHYLLLCSMIIMVTQIKLAQ